MHIDQENLCALQYTLYHSPSSSGPVCCYTLLAGDQLEPISGAYYRIPGASSGKGCKSGTGIPGDMPEDAMYISSLSTSLFSVP
jgi:hypothetical protein